MNVVGSCCVYKIKMQANGSVKRYTTHLVVKGFTQQEKIDYFRTFNLVVKPTIKHLVFIIVVSQGWKIS